jgi:hypothetical protein
MLTNTNIDSQCTQGPPLEAAAKANRTSNRIKTMKLADAKNNT